MDISTPDTPHDDEPPKLHEVLGGAAIVVAACAGIALCFAALATRACAEITLKRIRKIGGRHVP